MAYYGMPCGCRVSDDDDTRTVRWCQMHAAAPEMLAALEACVEQGIWSGHNGEEQERASSVWAKANAAVAKATGTAAPGGA